MALGFGQELNCEVIVNAEQTGSTNITIFKTLENSLTEFVNQTKWTNREFAPQERINCSMFINIREYNPNTNSFSGSIQVQSSRPVYGSTMVSPVFNYNDEQFSFTYTEYESLDYSPTQFNSNLTSVVSFYVYTMLGLDADTFEEEGGTSYFETANQIIGTAQQSQRSGWSAGNGNRSRFQLNNELLSNAFIGHRQALYTYHRKGLDLMYMSPENGKAGITTAILDLNDMNRSRPNSLLVRTFFDAKADEIQQVYSGGPSVSTPQLVDALNNMAPTFAERWSNIR
ncbi:DUF4835 family protein [Salinimicrobium sp. GXAS 041]|uniref:type IX secretion system protein PorD n=1 Tax=Salinimicrobium sp. GXAS 041 TaxID=3400806 RepID=UPI003C78B1CB